MLRIALALAFSAVTAAARGGDTFAFAPPDNTRFVRTLTHTARLEGGGLVRTETTILKAEFVFHETKSGYQLVMTPVSFRYVVNDHDVPSPVWDLIHDRKLTLTFNSVGKLGGVRGYEEIDKTLEKDPVNFSGSSPSIHLDHIPIGKNEQQVWDYRILLWLDQPSRVGTKLQFDSRERGFTGELVPAHTMMQVVRAAKCGERRCVETHYTMTPDLRGFVSRTNALSNYDVIDASASEDIEQTIEPDTMLPHFERLTWKAAATTASDDEEQRHGETSLVLTSEFTYRKR